MPRDPGTIEGKYGSASQFGSLDEWALSEADEFLRTHPHIRRHSITPDGYRHYIFRDTSEVWIRNDGQVIRIPHRIYNEDGSRIKGYRLNIFSGEILSSLKWHELPRSEQEWVKSDANNP